MREYPTTFSGGGYYGIKYLNRGKEDFSILAAGIQHCTKDFKCEYVARPGWHLHAVISGKGYFTADGRSQQVHEGQLFMVKPGEITSYRADAEDPWFYAWVTYDGPRAAENMEAAGFGPGVNVLDSYVDMAGFYKTAKELISHAALTDSEELMRMGCAYRYLSLAVLSFEKKSENQLKDGVLSQDDYVRYAVEYLDKNYSDVKISDVSDYLGLSRTYLSEIFKKKMYISPQEYLIRLRMEKSRQLLLQTRWSIYMIAKSVGYDDQLAFSRMFKKKFGVSPDRYRRQMRGQQNGQQTDAGPESSGDEKPDREENI